MPTQIITMADGLRYSVTQGITRFMAFLPALLGAIVILFFGWVISGWMGRAIEAGLRAVGMDRVTERAGLHTHVSRLGENWSGSRVLGELGKWFLRLIFVQAAANVLGMPQITAIVNSIILFIPKLAVAMLILVVGVFAARWLADMVRASMSNIGVGSAKVLGLVTQYAIMGFAIITALSQIEVAPVIVNGLYIGLIASLALAFGLAFGLGGRDVASTITRTWYEQGKSKVERIQPNVGKTPTPGKANLPPTGTSL